MKKILSSLLIGAFVFGIGAVNIQPVNASSIDKVKETKQKYDKAKEKFDKATNGDKNNDSNRPEPPKDANGNPIAPPNHDGDSSNRPEPPKDANGNPIAPPDRNNFSK